ISEFQKVRFVEHGINLQPSQPDYTSKSREGAPTRELLGSKDLRDVAELQWRLSSPLLALILTLLAVPLARANPREGRYGKFITAVLVYVVYSNLLGVAQVWIERAAIPPWIGLWFVHLLVIAVAAALLLKQNGWRHFSIKSAGAAT
ncbi:MAG: LptF/LptG family permease, partial [Gammaproteobacteria bacterium]|nr:LptF/LptG family permease [Gammaproteobacteria bacterium]